MEGMEHTSNADLRTAADTVLARLVGDASGTARLRDDQWRAIEALVAERTRVKALLDAYKEAFRTLSEVTLKSS